MNVDDNRHERRVCHGASSIVMSRGELIVEKGACSAKPGRGKYLKRAPRA